MVILRSQGRWHAFKHYMSVAPTESEKECHALKCAQFSSGEVVHAHNFARASYPSPVHKKYISFFGTFATSEQVAVNICYI